MVAIINKNLVIISSLVLLCTDFLFSQQLRNYQGRYTLNSQTTGNASYSYYRIGDDSIQFHGRFSFQSDVLQFEANRVRQVSINGTYRRGNKNGDWIYEKNDFNIKFNRITGVNLESSLDGRINRLNARYANGLAEGRWSLMIQDVRDSKKLTGYASSIVNFKAGKAAGKFSFTDPTQSAPIQVEGQFDEEAFFDRSWKLWYESGGIKYEEEREYASGFLVSLILKNAATQEVYYNEQFTDIRSKLNLLAVHESGTNFKMGDVKFGIQFNDGYRQDDTKLLAQQMGNEVLREVFDYYVDSQGVLFTLPGFTKPVLGNTRRFQYVYPEKEGELLELLRPMIAEMRTRYDSILNSSVLRINHQRNDTLSFYFSLLDSALSKLQIIEAELNEIESGKFDYQFRDNFYRNGVNGLNGTDTIYYEYRDQRLFWLINIGDKVVAPDSLVLNLYRYTSGLDAYVTRFYDQVQPTILGLQQEERIAKLDETIVRAMDTFFITYIGDSKINTSSSSDEELQQIQKLNELQLIIFKRFTREVLRQKMQEYINTDSYELRTARGNRILELVEALTTLYPKFSRIPQLPTELDEVFTRYSPNPFFERDVVTRIKQGIYSRGVELLMTHLVEELKKSNTREELVERVETIFRLDTKLRELAGTDDQETNRLNSRIRRENQPERIKRLLGV